VDNDYTHEIAELQSQVDAMVEAEANPKEIAELEMQLQILRAIYEQATQLHEVGVDDEEMRQHLAIRGYGEWTLDNVYAFVFDSTTDLPSEGHRSFLGVIREANFAAQLR
jgi:hypothetical protein